VSIDLIERARSGDQEAFEQLVGPYRTEVQGHCYRFPGSLADAEDALQEPSPRPGAVWPASRGERPTGSPPTAA
jgi:hypothetical protein